MDKTRTPFLPQPSRVLGQDSRCTDDTQNAGSFVFPKPSVGFYNIFNLANFDLPTSVMSGLLTGTAGTINGTDPLAHNANRVGVGTGVFTLGSPREIEFSLKITY